MITTDFKLYLKLVIQTLFIVPTPKDPDMNQQLEPTSLILNT